MWNGPEHSPMQQGLSAVPSYTPPSKVSRDMPSARYADVSTPPSRSDHSSGSGEFRAEVTKLVVTAAIFASAIISWTVLKPGLNPETRSGSWKYVTAASDASKQQNAPIAIFVDKTGKTTATAEISLTSSDQDVETTAKIINISRSGANLAGIAMLNAAQQIPVVNDAKTGQPLPRKVPSVSPEVVGKLASDRCRLFRVRLRDCADEDGDVVEIVLNGVTFAQVPLTGNGASLVFLLETSTPNKLAVRGLRDGGGGITVEFRTSEGSYFCPAISVGEEFPLGINTSQF